MYRRWDDIGYYIVANPDGHYCDFIIYLADGISESDEPFPFHAKSKSGYPNSTNDIESAEVFCTGHVKWDGCSDWVFSNSIHFCREQQAADLGTCFLRIYQWAKELIENYDY